MSSAVRLVDSTSLSSMPEGLEGRVARLAAIGVDAVNLRWRQWEPSLLDAVRAGGVLAFAWDAQSVATLTYLVEMGIDAVYSDHVARMVGVVSSGDRRRGRSGSTTGG